MRSLVRIDFSAYLFGALLLLALPLNWLIAAFAAAAFHELCHIFMISHMGGRILGVKIGIGGAVIDTEPLSSGKELSCALAGPVGSLLLVLLCRVFPRLAICAGIQALFNLLPIFPLDGGRALRCAMELISPKRADRIAEWVERVMVAAVAVLAVIAMTVYHLGVLPLLAALMLLIKLIMRKRPCKPARIGVQ